MASEDPKSDNRNSTKPDLVIPPLITGVFAVITTCITAISIIYAAYLSKQNQQIQATSTVISGTATQFVLLTENAPTATFPPSFTPYPTYTDQPTYTPFPTFTSVPTPDALFKDDFSDNHNGWDLSGPITLSNGELTITAKPNEDVWVTLPNFAVGVPNYYIQAKMKMSTENCGCYNGFAVGYGLGEKDGSYHKFFFQYFLDGFNFYHNKVAFYDNGKSLSTEDINDNDRMKLWGTYYTIRLEMKSGQATLYHDGIATITKQITPYGPAIGFHIHNSEGGDLNFSFDDLIVRELP